jgi:hypothetical protein
MNGRQMECALGNSRANPQLVSVVLLSSGCAKRGGKVEDRFLFAHE